MKRFANPKLSSSGEAALAYYRQALLEYEDLTDASRRNYLSDPRHFAAWYEARSIQSADEPFSSRAEFAPMAHSTPVVVRYRAYLQKDIHQEPNSVNRAVISVKRYCHWAMQNISSLMTPRFQSNLLAKKCVFLVIWMTLFAEAYPLFIGKKELSMGILVQKLEKGAARR